MMNFKSTKLQEIKVIITLVIIAKEETSLSKKKYQDIKDKSKQEVALLMLEV